ncbi:hypothetical protein [Paraherbaspirillum soli]|uniref:HEAT repeat domain-containing protein n=1 Tax=Paraherbaspirillum soli TaxID=631222 RepID=A0ABW0MGY2_9BURK
MFQKYDDYLNGVREFDDYWSDVGISEAIEILNAFTEKDWEILKEKIEERPQIWLVSCAETLSEVSDVNHAYDVLLHLIEKDTEEVVISAIDAINALASYGFNVLPDSTQLRHGIERARKKAGKVGLLVLDSLEKKLA